MISVVCACRSAEAERATEKAPAAKPPSGPVSAEPRAPAESCLGVADRGIWSDLDPQVQIALPADLTPDRVSATVDDKHQVLVLYVDDWPTKPYPLGGDATLAVGDRTLHLRPGDRTELAPLLRADRLAAPRGADRDKDGIPDPLDTFLGAAKTVLNADAYTEGYVSMRYPMGDVPRTMGVCTDVVIRALRNAGLDLQAELHADIARAPRAYPMVKGKGDPSIDQRRVRTILPFFQRHLEAHTAAADDATDPYRPGDVVFMDTFPSRPGPDHIGVVSSHKDADGLPLIINNWTDGTVTAEMDLLTFVPITHRFRLAPRK
ncbi:MAG: DUF1287 domain-containing protein [Deltaproteobacteria bacterium]|nr:DUF1287 domain-containing protein [Deltaproteobacteria bacterium]